MFSKHIFFRKTTMKKLLREIYVEHFHDIFPENSENVPYGILWDVPKQCSGNTEYRNIP